MTVNHNGVAVKLWSLQKKHGGPGFHHLVTPPRSDTVPVPLQEAAPLAIGGVSLPNSMEGTKSPPTTFTEVESFFDAMWERILPEIIPNAASTSIRDYVNIAKRCTSGKEKDFPAVQTVGQLIGVCQTFVENFEEFTHSKQPNRIKKVVKHVTAYVRRVGFDAARDYFQGGVPPMPVVPVA